MKKIYHAHKVLGVAGVVPYLITACVCPLMLIIYRLVSGVEYIRGHVQFVFQLAFPICAIYLGVIYLKDRVEGKGRDTLLRFEKDQIYTLLMMMFLLWGSALTAYALINIVSDVFFTDILRSLLQISFQMGFVLVLSYVFKATSPAFMIALLYTVICLMIRGNSAIVYISYQIYDLPGFWERYQIMILLTAVCWSGGILLHKSARI